MLKKCIKIILPYLLLCLSNKPILNNSNGIPHWGYASFLIRDSTTQKRMVNRRKISHNINLNFIKLNHTNLQDNQIIGEIYNSNFKRKKNLEPFRFTSLGHKFSGRIKNDDDYMENQSNSLPLKNILETGGRLLKARDKQNNIAVAPMPSLGYQETFQNLKDLLKKNINESKYATDIDKDKICERDFSNECPAGWEIADEDYCRSPSDYNGPCSHLMRIDSRSPDSLMKLSKLCKVRWPCLYDRCESFNNTDYKRPCPENWIHNKVCLAPESYKGPCDRNQDIAHYDIVEKEKFASTCLVNWPCNEEPCERDYYKPCPKGWIYNNQNDTCEPPKNYDGSCPLFALGISKITSANKKSLEAECNLVWPCKTKMNCEPDYTNNPCPEGWNNAMESGACEAPADYDEGDDCPKLIHFDFLSTEDKRNFAIQCRVSWPCESEVLLNYDSCPIDWEEINTRWCTPTTSYIGPCKGRSPINFSLMSIKEKKVVAELCEVHFPPKKKNF